MRLLLILLFLALVFLALRMVFGFAGRTPTHGDMAARSPEEQRWIDAWRAAARRGAIRRRVLEAQERCERLLGQIATHPAHPDTQEFVDAMCRRVPEAIEEHLRAIRAGTRAEVARDEAALAKTLGIWAEGAEQRRLTERSAVEARLETARRYAESRSPGSPD